MEEVKAYAGHTFLVPELDDVLEAKDLGRDHTVDDWPWGRKQRCSMHFFVESNKRGERLVKQSTMNGRRNMPKKKTYATKVKVVEIDGKIGHVEWSADYGMFGVTIQDGKYASQTFYDTEGKMLRDMFFGDEY